MIYKVSKDEPKLTLKDIKNESIYSYVYSDTTLVASVKSIYIKLEDENSVNICSGEMFNYYAFFNDKVKLHEIEEITIKDI